MKYEWDEAKNRTIVAKRGLSFEDAEQVFVGPCVTFETIVWRTAKNGSSLWAWWLGVWLSEPMRRATTGRASSEKVNLKRANKGRNKNRRILWMRQP
jgi:hypothetical protein